MRATRHRAGRKTGVRWRVAWTLGLCVVLCGAGPVAEDGEPGSDGEGPPDPAALLQQVKDHYRSAATYAATGKALTRILQPESGAETAIGVEFRMWLGRPNLYRIEWTEHRNFGKTESGAVWNDGSGPHLFQGAANAYARMKSDPIALAAATGISMGVAHTVPSLFFAFDDTPGLLDRVESPALQATETVDGVSCHVVAASLPSGVEYRFWISKEAPVVVQVENLLGGSSDTHAIPDPTPEQEEQALRAMNLEVTEANRERVRASLRKARDVMKQVRGTARQLHQDIRVSAPLATEAFAFELPPGASVGLEIAGAAP